MFEIYATQPTVIKRNTKSSHLLSDNEKFNLVPGDNPLKATWQLQEGSHYKFELVEPFKGVYNWYAFADHIKVVNKRSGSLSPERRAFLDMIAYAEGTDRKINGQPEGYNVMFSHKLFDSYADHPRKAITSGGYTSTAAGRYQFLAGTWDECKHTLRLPDFSAKSQDEAAIYLIRRRGALDEVDAGNIRGACVSLSYEWASLPYNEAGHGRYGQPTRKFDELEDVYRRSIKYYDAVEPLSERTGTYEVGDRLPRSVNLNVPYLSQTDNVMHPLSTCNTTCLAMVLKFFQISGNTATRQLEDELTRYALNHGLGRTVHRDLVKIFDKYGVDDKFGMHATWEQVKVHLANGNPVIMSGCFTRSGHLILLRGYDATGFWVNDPYGEWFSSGYAVNDARHPNRGENKHYSYQLCSRVSVTGPRTTWAHFPQKR